MKLSRKRIHSIFIQNMLMLSLVSIGLWSAVWIYGEISAFNRASQQLRQQHIEDQKRALRNEVTGIVKYVRYMKNQGEKNIKETLRSRVNEAHAVAVNIYPKKCKS